MMRNTPIFGILGEFTMNITVIKADPGRQIYFEYARNSNEMRLFQNVRFWNSLRYK
jgi:hypothetical protein